MRWTRKSLYGNSDRDISDAKVIGECSDHGTDLYIEGTSDEEPVGEKIGAYF